MAEELSQSASDKARGGNSSTDAPSPTSPLPTPNTPQAASAQHPAGGVRPTPDTPSSTMYGGQAVIEGVMMRGPKYFAVACRKANGEIALICEAVPKLLRPSWQKLPFIRGAFAIVDSMALGTKSLFWAAKIASEDVEEAGPKLTVKDAPAGDVPATVAPTKASPDTGNSKGVTDIAIGSALVVGLGGAVFLFKILPQFGLEGLKQFGIRGFRLGIADFFIRFSIFIGYILLVSRMEYVFRVFQYHGAEHKAINALEAGQELTVENAHAASRLHPRCGTSFLVIVILLSVLAISPFYDQPLWARILIQLAVLMPVAGVSFELLRLAGKFRHNPIANALSQPGMWTQLLTTREPDPSQVEVSLASLKAVMQAEEADALREKERTTAADPSVAVA